MVRVNARPDQLSGTIRKSQLNKAPYLHGNHIKALMCGLPHRKMIYVGDVQIAKEKALPKRPEQLNKIALMPGTFDGLIVRSNIVDLSFQKESFVNALKDHPQAEVLILSHTPTTGLNMVRENITLKTLMMGFSNVNNIMAAKGLKALETLDISYTPAMYLDPLEGSATLKNLMIAGSLVQDINVLKGIRTLRSLVVHKEQIPALQLYEFKKAMPECEVIPVPYIPAVKMKVAAKEPWLKATERKLIELEAPEYTEAEELGLFGADEG